jgi:type IV secretory pathway VirJ component
VLLGPGREANFEFYVSDWLGGSSSRGLPTFPEINKLAGKNLLCIYGDDESNSICPEISQKGAKIIALPGTHHFNGDYTGIVDKIMSTLNEPRLYN